MICEVARPGICRFLLNKIKKKIRVRRGFQKRVVVVTTPHRVVSRDRGSLPFEQNGPKEDIDDLRVVVRICPL